MFASIDHYKNEISMALEAGDATHIARIAEAFCTRCHYYKPWKIDSVEPFVCPSDGLQARIGIRYHDNSRGEVRVGFVHGKRRITLNSEHVSCESSADVVHSLQVPCCFFDGIYYAMEGFSDVARQGLSSQIARWDSEAREMREQWDREYANLERIRREQSNAQSRLEKSQKTLCSVVQAMEAIGDCREMTVVPLDWHDRFTDACDMVALAEVKFVSLVDAKDLLQGVAGVYFGWRVTDGKCVYVGKSSNLGSRLHKGRAELIDCKITYIEMPEEHIHTWELFYIWLHKPERNNEVRQAEIAAMRCRQGALGTHA